MKTTAATAANTAPNVRRYTYRQALLIALQGMHRMYQRFYSSAKVEECRYVVTKPDGTEYFVFIGEGDAAEVAYCSCPFSGYGRVNPCCKHIEFARSMHGLFRPDLEVEYAPILE